MVKKVFFFSNNGLPTWPDINIRIAILYIQMIFITGPLSECPFEAWNINPEKPSVAVAMSATDQIPSLVASHFKNGVVSQKGLREFKTSIKQVGYILFVLMFCVDKMSL